LIEGLILAASSLGAFFVHYTFDPAVSCFEFPHGNFSAYPWFMALMFSAFRGPRSPIAFVTTAGIIGVLFAASTLVIAIHRLLVPIVKGNTRLVSLIITILVSYSMLFAANRAVGRVCRGLPDAAFASRYSTLLIPAYLGLYFLLLLLPATNIRKIALGFLLPVLIPGGVLIPNSQGHKLADGKRAWHACYLRTGDIGYCDRTTGFPI